MMIFLDNDIVMGADVIEKYVFIMDFFDIDIVKNSIVLIISRKENEENRVSIELTSHLLLTILINWTL